MFDQIRTDHGKEFVLLQFVQESLAHLRRNVNIDPHRQTQSKHVSKNVSNIYNVYIRVQDFTLLARRLRIDIFLVNLNT